MTANRRAILSLGNDANNSTIEKALGYWLTSDLATNLLRLLKWFRKLLESTMAEKKRQRNVIGAPDSEIAGFWNVQN